MLIYKKVCISGMTGVSDENLNSYKTKVEERCPGAQVDILSKDILSEEEVIQQMQGYDILMSGFQTMTEKAYANTDLKAFVACSIGIDFANIKEATKHGVVVANNPTYCTEEVAEHTVALVLACARNVVKMSNAVREGKWGFPVIAPQYRFKGSTVGLYGFGRISRMLAEKLSGFGVNIIASDPFITQEQVGDTGVTMVSFDELLERSDYISLHAPLTESTKGIFNKEVFSRMKTSACIINAARGPLINQPDLYDALTQGKIRAAALDVIENEPPTDEDKKLLSLPNVICTGHTGFYSVQALEDQNNLTVDNIVRVLNGQLPQNIVNRDVIEKISWYNTKSN